MPSVAYADHIQIWCRRNRLPGKIEVMKSTIHIFGHDDTFDSDSIRQYIESDIFDEDYDRRYRHSLLRNDVEIIVLSHAGKAYGHFEIIDSQRPKASDIRAWAKTKRVYIVIRSHSYEKPVTLKDLGITRIQYGKPINAGMLQKIQKRAGKVTTHQPAET